MGVPRNIPGSPGKIAGNFFSDHKILQIHGFRAPAKANLPGTLALGPTLPGPCPHLPCGVLFEIDSSSLLHVSVSVPTDPKIAKQQFSLERLKQEITQRKGTKGVVAIVWKATKEYLNQRGTKIRVFRVCFRTPFLPPFFPHFSPLFPLQALCILAPLLPSSPPPSSPPFWLPEKSDLGTPLI